MDAAERRVIFPFKWLEDMSDKIFADADAVVGYRKLIDAVVIGQRL